MKDKASVCKDADELTEVKPSLPNSDEFAELPTCILENGNIDESRLYFIGANVTQTRLVNVPIKPTYNDREIDQSERK